MRITVTQEDIEKGVRRNCVRCPIALAMTRQTGLPWFVDERGGIVFSHKHPKNIQLMVDLPWQAMDFMSGFDSGLPMFPFTFDLDITSLEGATQ